MKQMLVCLTVIIAHCSLFCQLHWQHTYHSGLMANNQRIVRTRAEQDSVELLVKNTTEDIVGINMNNLEDGYNNYQVQIDNPLNNYVGLKYVSTDRREVAPIFFDSNLSPQLNDLTPLFEDPAGDQLFSQTNLDIRNTYATFNNNRLYFGIKNNGGGFPTSSGFTYFSYMATLVNPDADSTANTIVYGLMYTVNIAGIITPGLYKISGTGLNDMTLIGQITSSINTANNTLILSCNIADLQSDSDFSSWYNPLDPKIGFMALSSRITLTSGIQLADQSSSCFIIPKAISINPSAIELPQVSNTQIICSMPEGQFYVYADYYHPEALLPIVAEIHYSNGHVSPLVPVNSPDFENSVAYGCQLDLEQVSGWTSAIYKFSCDGIVFTESLFYNTESIDVTAPEVNEGARPYVYPNPSKGVFSIVCNPEKNILRSEIFDIKGRIISKHYPKIENFINADLRHLNNGVYFIKTYTKNQVTTTKLIIIK